MKYLLERDSFLGPKYCPLGAMEQQDQWDGFVSARQDCLHLLQLYLGFLKLLLVCNFRPSYDGAIAWEFGEAKPTPGTKPNAQWFAIFPTILLLFHLNHSNVDGASNLSLFVGFIS